MSTPIPVAKEVAVIGGTPEGRRVVQELLALGYAVHWLSLPGDAPQALPGHPRLTSLVDGMPSRVAGHVGDFCLTVGRDGTARDVCASAVVVAIGNARVAALPTTGVASAARVLTLAQLGARLAAPQDVGAAMAHRNLRVLILLDWEHATSREMAAEAFVTAERVRRAWHSEVCILYQELTVDAPGMEATTRRMREQGIVFCRYEEGAIEDGALLADDEGVAITYAEGRLTGDLLVVPEIVQPREETAALAALLRVTVGADGYFQDVSIHQYRPGLSVRRGVFVAGRCHADLSVAEAEADALQVVALVDGLLGAGVLAPEGEVAAVDATACIRCLTCVRTCPHAAIEIVTRHDRTAAHVVELACRGCGACVGNCPVQAISLSNHAWPAWMQAAE
ncbi:MAG TPA: 4Fe-4S binding protein [Chloroflexi bacterium]|jgi:Pyruvate/2-oxoacid:ferredoxin oxidoreductase delta subunit|nr:4Fe-4S binding protein [Chloroflexota bacterium]